MTDRRGYQPALLSLYIVGVIFSAAASVLNAIMGDFITATVFVVIFWAILAAALGEAKR